MCKHIIGIWYDYESTDIITLDGLKMRISDIKNMNKYKINEIIEMLSEFIKEESGE